MPNHNAITNLNRELRVLRRKNTRLRQENEMLKAEVNRGGRFTWKDVAFLVVLFEVITVLAAISYNQVL